MDRSKIVIVRGVFSDDIGKLIIQRGYCWCQFFKKQSNFFLRSVRRVWNKLNLPGKSIWYDKKILSVDSQEIVIMDALCNVEYLTWLRKKKPNAKIVFWYWNIAKNSIPPYKIPDGLVDKWSFSRKDCAKYGMRFNPLPYFSELAYSSEQKEFDIVFVGKDKGRLDMLLKLKADFESLGLNTKFVITPDHPYSNHPAYSKPISYLESVQLDTKAKAVLDYIEIDDSGQSLRILESIFIKEKIITNSKLIFDYDFYCPENFFVLGHDDLSELPKFISTPYKNLSDDIVQKYDFDYIVGRFFSDEYTIFDEMLKKMMEKSDIGAK